MNTLIVGIWGWNSFRHLWKFISWKGGNVVKVNSLSQMSLWWVKSRKPISRSKNINRSPGSSWSTSFHSCNPIWADRSGVVSTILHAAAWNWSMGWGAPSANRNYRCMVTNHRRLHIRKSPLSYTFNKRTSCIHRNVDDVIILMHAHQPGIPTIGSLYIQLPVAETRNLKSQSDPIK